MNTKELTELYKKQEEAEELRMRVEREQKMRELENISGKKARKMVLKPEYKLDERLGCYREIN